ncbi:uncharacterized protein LOC134218078 [Armigeres subalbatus]|uniref:uncharacterized protein LOC134218078 n=1 Tax=Armigeres subalbatus TaxID=124917 RepID=UPI002ED0B248
MNCQVYLYPGVAIKCSQPGINYQYQHQTSAPQYVMQQQSSTPNGGYQFQSGNSGQYQHQTSAPQYVMQQQSSTPNGGYQFQSGNSGQYKYQTSAPQYVMPYQTSTLNGNKSVSSYGNTSSSPNTVAHYRCTEKKDYRFKCCSCGQVTQVKYKSSKQLEIRHCTHKKNTCLRYS